MKRGLIIILSICLLISLNLQKAEAVYGIPDQVRAATLIVPLMEKGISTVHNTLTVVQNICGGNITIHWELWDIDGVPVNIYGNVTLNGGAAWISDMGSIIASATPSQLSQLTIGGFYRGFMTIDVVTSATLLLPTESGYPFSSANCLSGFIYYVRLLEGAANGIPMVHIEGGLSGGLHPNVRGFYRHGDDREEIDNHARYYAERATKGLSIIDDPNNKLDFIISRVFESGNGETRIVIWAWGPPFYGVSTAPGDVGGPFLYQHFNEAGTLVHNATVSLSRVVNVIDVPVEANGIVLIADLPENFNVFAFSFNSAHFTLNPALTWEAMFESTIIAEW